MSPSPKKPSAPGVVDLRARLGLGPGPRLEGEKESPGLSPALEGRRHGPAPSGAPEAASDMVFGRAGTDELFAKITGAVPSPVPPSRAQPAAPLFTTPSPATTPRMALGAIPSPAPAPLAPLPPDEEPDEEETTAPGKDSPGLAPPTPSSEVMSAPPPDMDPLAFLEQAPQARREIEARISPVPQSAPAEPSPAAPVKPKDPFASPLNLQQGQALRAPRPAPLALPPPGYADHILGASEATMAALAPVQRKQALALIVVGTLVLAICSPLGYFVGRIGRERQIVNRRIDDAQNALSVMNKSVGKLKGMMPRILKMDPQIPDYDLAKRLKTFNCQLSVEDVAGDNLLLGGIITGELMQFASLANELHKKARHHGWLTFVKHREHLDQIINANKAALQGKQEIFVFFVPNAKPGAAPPKGHLVNIVGEPITEGKETRIPVSPLTSPTIQKVKTDLLIALDSKELLETAGPNVLQLHADRVDELKKLALKLDKMMDPLVRMIEKEADKPKVIAF